jgi:hypothetical protein
MSHNAELAARLEKMAEGYEVLKSKHAADLRAAAQAVRLVGTCKAALSKSKRTSKGWYEDTSAALDAITAWETPLPAPPEVDG